MEGFDSLAAPWSKLLSECPRCAPFFTPQWLKLWWRHFGSGSPLLLSVREGDSLAGVAPLKSTQGELSLLGSGDVCDYLDIIARPEHARAVCRAVVDFIQPMEWRKLSLFPLHAKSTTLEHLVPLLRDAGYRIETQQEDVSPKTELPPTWDAYMAGLDKKDRHELRRKMRRLEGQDGVGQQVITGGPSLHGDLEEFFAMFLESQVGKTLFLTPAMRDFFLDMAETAADMGWLRLFFLNIDGARTSVVMALDYGDTMYLYNSGYYQRYSHLAVGLLLKAYCIQYSIERGKRCFDFLRGGEPYKYDLGGHDMPVFRCSVSRG